MAEPSEASEAGVSKKAKAAAARAQDKASEALETVRGKVGNLQATVADAIDAGAGALRESGGVAAEAEADARARGRVAEVSQTVAGGLDHTATWLRENDLTDLGGLLRQQLRERPGRTALIVLGLGFVLGRASRR